MGFCSSDHKSIPLSWKRDHSSMIWQCLRRIREVSWINTCRRLVHVPIPAQLLQALWHKAKLANHVPDRSISIHTVLYTVHLQLECSDVSCKFMLYHIYCIRLLPQCFLIIIDNFRHALSHCFPIWAGPAQIEPASSNLSQLAQIWAGSQNYFWGVAAKVVQKPRSVFFLRNTSISGQQVSIFTPWNALCIA